MVEVVVVIRRNQVPVVEAGVAREGILILFVLVRWAVRVTEEQV